jgi:hypothetical protein
LLAPKTTDGLAAVAAIPIVEEVEEGATAEDGNSSKEVCFLSSIVAHS